jgi:hypothetical protein
MLIGEIQMQDDGCILALLVRSAGSLPAGMLPPQEATNHWKKSLDFKLPHFCWYQSPVAPMRKLWTAYSRIYKGRHFWPVRVGIY